jgi:Flp pilus assembly protein TadG
MFIRRTWREAYRFRAAQGASVGTIFAIAFPVLVGVAVIAVDLTRANGARSRLQTLADAAAVAAARELRLGNASADVVLGVARTHVAANSSDVAFEILFDGKVASDKSAVTVQLTGQMSSGLASRLGFANASPEATATAKVVGGAPLCLIGLDSSANKTIALDKNARIEARGCAVYSNSKHKIGLFSKMNASLTAAMICSAGGSDGGPGNFDPAPSLDCPSLPDPLASRPMPVAGSCDPARTNVKISGQDIMLDPGTYCGGLTITSGATVTLNAGIYILKDGEFWVSSGSAVKGVGVGFYFTGAKASFRFDKETSISLSAPIEGLLAGLLFAQDRSMKQTQTFEISSDGADMLLGTFYLPNGRLYMGGEKPVAQNSAYTIIVARKIEAEAGPTIVLNSNYTATNVPVPDGVGSMSKGVRLTN